MNRRDFLKAFSSVAPAATLIAIPQTARPLQLITPKDAYFLEIPAPIFINPKGGKTNIIFEVFDLNGAPHVGRSAELMDFPVQFDKTLYLRVISEAATFLVVSYSLTRTTKTVTICEAECVRS